MFQQQKLAQEQEMTKAKGLANIFNEQQNPQLIEKQRIDNQEGLYGLTQKRINSNIATQTEPQQYQQAIKDAVLKLSKTDLDSI